MSYAAMGVALLAALSLTACGGAESSDSTSPAPTTTAEPADRSEGTPIRITVGDATLTGRLDDNATARDLADQLPVTLTVRDHNRAEKTGPLPRQLSTDGVAPGHDPSAGDIGYWAPDGDLVFYYDDAAPYFDGIVRIGKLHGDLAALRRQGDGVAVTVARAN